MTDLFMPEVEAAPVESGHLTVIPISVIDIMAQGKRLNENHGSTSSRANFSPFPNEIVTLCYEFYLRNATHIFDPFSGWGERGDGARRHGKKYIGFDISPDACAKAVGDYGIVNYCVDSRYADPPEFDGLFTCPPYWNLEKYAHPSGLDREKKWQDFLRWLDYIFMRSFKAAKPGSNFCVMVGDWRKDHIYYDLEWNVCEMFKGFGAEIVDKVVVSRSKVSKIKIMLPQAKRLGYSVRVHENLLVFRKPDRSGSAARLPQDSAP